MFQRRDQKSPQPPLLAIRRCEPALFEKMPEEFLREVLRVMRRLPAAPDKRVKRTLIGAADRLQRGIGFRRGLLGGGQHHRPARARENLRLRP